jgi:hypothetical protein
MYENLQHYRTLLYMNVRGREGWRGRENISAIMSLPSNYTYRGIGGEIGATILREDAESGR